VPRPPGKFDLIVAIVVGDNGEIAMSLAVRDLVDTDPEQVAEPGVVEPVGDHRGPPPGNATSPNCIGSPPASTTSTARIW
jgi:hypothetical protein